MEAWGLKIEPEGSIDQQLQVPTTYVKIGHLDSIDQWLQQFPAL
jgi:hypothetical protein